MLLALAAALVLNGNPPQSTFDFDDDLVEVTKVELASATEAAKDKSRITAETPALARTRTKEELRNTVRQAMPGFKDCYTTGLVSKPNLLGKVAVKFTIELNGRVKTAKVSENTLGDKAVAACIERRAKELVFSGADVLVVVTYPFVFKATE